MARGHASRKRGSRESYKILVIVCEGKTEKVYFENYRERKSGLKIELPITPATDPESLVKFALSRIPIKDLDLDNGDALWCVFDANNHTDQEISKAVKLASDNGVSICFSNPCFELWYLLHFLQQRNRILGKDVITALQKYIQNYEKGKDYFKELLSKRENAVKCANELDKEHRDKSIVLLSTKSNPSTKVFELIEFIKKVIEENKR